MYGLSRLRVSSADYSLLTRRTRLTTLSACFAPRADTAPSTALVRDEVPKMPRAHLRKDCLVTTASGALAIESVVGREATPPDSPLHLRVGVSEAQRFAFTNIAKRKELRSAAPLHASHVGNARVVQQRRDAVQDAAGAMLRLADPEAEDVAVGHAQNCKYLFRRPLEVVATDLGKALRHGLVPPAPLEPAGLQAERRQPIAELPQQSLVRSAAPIIQDLNQQSQAREQVPVSAG
mmetsp:Transcript_165868/g.532550  ORF Transcript_165868/g.532550 Transcript_165868/m.532550 type:complete len:235 (+) Transcript_165868:88-792(+)